MEPIEVGGIQRAGGAVASLVSFEVGGLRYAVEIAYVREILRPLPILALPHMPSTVVGVVDHRGDVVPIIDLRERFSTPQDTSTAAQRWVIVTSQGRLTALVVDCVVEVFTVAEDAARTVPEIGSGDEQRGIKVIYAHGEGLVFVLDVDRLARPGSQVDFGGARAELASRRPDAS